MGHKEKAQEEGSAGHKEFPTLHMQLSACDPNVNTPSSALKSWGYFAG